MSTAVGGLEAVPTTAAVGAQTTPAVAAAERVQQLQALLAQVEHHSSGTTFASALGAAQAAGASSSPTTGVPSTAAMTEGVSSSPVPISGAMYPAATGAGSSYTPLIEQAAARYGLDPSVLYGLIQQESGFDPAARSGAGALGLTQLMPSTAASLGVTEPLDPAQSIEGGARYLSQLLHQFGGNTADALAAYNAGPGAVQQYGGVPPYPETQQYVTKVLGYAASFRGGEGVAPAQTASYTGATAIPSVGSTAVSGAIA
jgi:soluble lytic murein transglycosylase-like protein